MDAVNNSLIKGTMLISNQFGIVNHVSKLPRLNYDPKLVSFGIWPSNTLAFGAEKYEGRSSGCNFDLQKSFMGTLGETVERYCPVFYNKENMILSSYKNLKVHAIPPSEYALFHEKQYAQENYPLHRFDENIELHWDKCMDITNGKETWVPGACIYLPWSCEKQWINVSTSTGLAAHTNWDKALLVALHEVIERDSFSLTWWQKISAPKIIIDEDISHFIHERFPASYEWHFMDITYDLGIPTVYGICFGEAEYGKFVAVGTATRDTYGEALKKVILEMGQSVSYFRYLLGEKKNWQPSENFHTLLDFEDHSILYIKKPELCEVFKIWTETKPTRKIDFLEESARSTKENIRHITSVLKSKGYNVLVKDITTPDVNQAGFYCLRVIVPQLIQMGSAYSFYFLGGKRLYTIPQELGYKCYPFEELNVYPHPFP